MRFWLSLFLCLFFSSSYAEEMDSSSISFDDYKALVRYVQKENKYEGLIHVVPTAREKFENMVEKRPSTYKAYGPIIQAALRQTLHELDGAPIPEASVLENEEFKKNPNFVQHKKVIKHVLEELNVERKLKHKDAYPDQSVATLELELAHLKSSRPHVPLEVDSDQEITEEEKKPTQDQAHQSSQNQYTMQ